MGRSTPQQVYEGPAPLLSPNLLTAARQIRSSELGVSRPQRRRSPGKLNRLALRRSASRIISKFCRSSIGVPLSMQY